MFEASKLTASQPLALDPYIYIYFQRKNIAARDIEYDQRGTDTDTFLNNQSLCNVM